jgi:5-methylcytosine-specific restriction endonuclease McrBC regulatory subunit McrC
VATTAGPLELHEKIEGSLAALLGFASFDAFRIEEAPVKATELGGLIALLVRQFLSEVLAYVSRGRERHYTRRREQGSLIGGRIDMTRTLTLRARGLGHLVAFDRTVLTRNTTQNKVIFAALREVEALPSLLSIPELDIRSGRTLVQFFNDVRDRTVLFGRREDLLELAERALGAASPVDKDMLALAAVILAHQSFEQSPPVDAVAPRAWFLNLETLFESAVRRSLGDAFGQGNVTKGGISMRPIFPERDVPHQADPDLIVTTPAAVVVGDVKYKDWDGELVDRDDLYQLLVHAAAFDAPLAFLIYPADEYTSISIGESVTGADVYAFGFPVSRLRESSRLFAGELARLLPSGKAEQEAA